MKKRVADIISDILVENSITECFALTGGGAMHLNDAFGHKENFHCTYFLHEQGAAIAAEAYARINNQLPVVCVTTGPGGINALTGVLCAWQDNIPMLVISGQVKTTAMVESTGLKLRQYGEQEHTIVETVANMTKYAVTVKDAKLVKYYIQKAIYEATNGRRGPCWIDIPLDIQGAEVDEDELEEFTSPQEICHSFDKEEIVEVLEKAKRPVILAGSAIRTSGAYSLFRMFTNKYEIPVIVAKSVADIMPNEDANYYGNFGINGGRAGNFIVQNADCLLVLGCRLSFGQIGFNYMNFSPKSKKIVVDVDAEELKKESVKIDCPVNADLKIFLEWIKEVDVNVQMDPNWRIYCNELRKNFPIYQDKYEDREAVNAYYFAKVMKEFLNENAIVVVGNSCSSVSIKQCGVDVEGQRMWGNINCGTMGYDIPAAIGAAIASEREVICCAGDGSFQMNIQELQTIVSYNLPVKIFVFNNGGYRSIVLSQSRNFGRLAGCTRQTGVALPELERIANAYRIPYYCCERNQDLHQIFEAVFEQEGYCICEIIEDEEHAIEPKLGNKILADGSIVSPSLLDLSPFLSGEIYSKFSSFEQYVEQKNWVEEK